MANISHHGRQTGSVPGVSFVTVEVSTAGAAILFGRCLVDEW